MGGLGWDGNTNTEENSCKTLKCDCLTFWEIHQQEAMKRLSNVKDAKKNSYVLESGYEARARRIASVYAKIYLERENYGNKQLIGRYYWMGLGAFASKTVAAIFKHGLVAWGYKWVPIGLVREPVHSFAKGNLWLFMDIAPWHYAWSMSPASFTQCAAKRNVSQFTHIKNQVYNLPWSNCLATIQYLQQTNEILKGFSYLPDIEAILKRKNFSKGDNFKAASTLLFDHLLVIAVQEQRNILQKLVWSDWKVEWQARVQKATSKPDSTLVLSSDYSVDAVKPDKEGEYKGRHKGVLNQLPKTVYSEQLPHTKVANYDSRMEWIQKAAEKYHDLMLSDNGREFLEKELAIIAGWGNSQAAFAVGNDSNDGKV